MEATEKRYLLITCPMIEKELNAIAAETAFPFPILYLPKDLHKDPKELHSYLQDLIDRCRNVDAIILSLGKCGNGTLGLKATTADLILPRSEDCIDLILSDPDLASVRRPKMGCFFTKSWIDTMGDFEFSLDALAMRFGKEQCIEIAREMYRGINGFHIVDTGVYDVPGVKNYIAPLAEAIGTTINIIPGKCGMIRRILNLQFDFHRDLMLIPKGETVTQNQFRQ